MGTTPLNGTNVAERNLPDPTTGSAGDWVSEHGDYLFRYALAKVRSRDLAEDLVQETFLAAWRARANFTGEASVRTWLTAILHRKLIDGYRRRSLEQKTFSTDAGEDRFSFDPFNRRGKWKSEPKGWTDPAENLTGAEFRAAFAACLAKLPPRWHEAFVLRYLDEETGVRVSRELGLTSANLWVILHRARLQMWQCLSKSWFGTKTQPGDESC